ncbi:hypothetical protein THAOC_29900, partial [Thalassiosira oceanica]
MRCSAAIILLASAVQSFTPSGVIAPLFADGWTSPPLWADQALSSYPDFRVLRRPRHFKVRLAMSSGHRQYRPSRRGGEAVRPSVRSARLPPPCK